MDTANRLGRAAPWSTACTLLAAMTYSLLLVDDDISVLFPLKRYFTMRAFEVASATTHEEAEALLAERRFSAVITDLRLGGADGAEGLDIVQSARDLCPGARIVVLTAYGSPENEAEARR